MHSSNSSIIGYLRRIFCYI